MVDVLKHILEAHVSNMEEIIEHFNVIKVKGTKERDQKVE